MLEYLAILLAISLLLLALFSRVKNRLPLRPQVIYGTVGIAFVLGAVFPMAISSLSFGGALTIYFGLVIFFAAALSYADSRVSLNVSPAPVKLAEMETESSPAEPDEDSPAALPEDVPALEACAAIDFSTKSETPGPLLSQVAEMPAPARDRPAVNDQSEDLAFTATIDSRTEEDLPHNVVLPPDADAPAEEVALVAEETMPEKQPFEDVLAEAVAKVYETKETTSEEEITSFAAAGEPPAYAEESPAYAEEELSAEEDVIPDERTDAVEGLPVADEVSFSQDPNLMQEQPSEEQPVFEAAVGGKDLPPLLEGIPEEEAAAGMEEAVITSDSLQTTYYVQYAPGLENEERQEPSAAFLKAVHGSINEYISAGFTARAGGNLTGAAECFFKALRLNPEKRTAVSLALEISAVYQELGQYLQGRMIIKSVLKQEDIFYDSSLKTGLESQLTYLESLSELLELAKMPNAPYSKIPNLIKIKASLETSVRLKELTKGGRVNEKQSADFGATGS